MKNILCVIPCSNEFPEKLYIYHHGKVASFMFITIISWFLFLAHYLVGVSQWWSVIILAFFLVYCLVPIKWYLYNVYTYFISSLLGVFFPLIVTYYISSQFINASNHGFFKEKVFGMVFLLSIYVIIVEIHQTRKNIVLYKNYIKNSIDKDRTKFFMIKNWFYAVKNGKFNKNEGVSLSLILILLIPVLIIGFFAGSPILSAKMVVDGEFDKLAYLVISLVLIIVSILFTIVMVRELLKVIALFQLDD